MHMSEATAETAMKSRVSVAELVVSNVGYVVQKRIR